MNASDLRLSSAAALRTTAACPDFCGPQLELDFDLANKSDRAKGERLDLRFRLGVEALRKLLAETADPRKPYTPYVRAVRSRSHGYVYRVSSRTTGRIVHLQSRGENCAHDVLDQSGRYQNIREGFPVPLPLTEAIAEALGIKHPYDRFAKENAIMSVDFLATLPNGKDVAIDYKPSDILDRPRTQAKFKLIREAFAAVGIRHVVITDKDLDPVLVKNLDGLYIFAIGVDAPPLPNAILMRAGSRLRDVLRDGSTSIYEAAVELEPEFGCGTGKLVRTALWMIARRHWSVDLMKPVEADLPITFKN